jgi:hypothetical protein
LGDERLADAWPIASVPSLIAVAAPSGTHLAVSGFPVSRDAIEERSGASSVAARAEVVERALNASCDTLTSWFSVAPLVAGLAGRR